ncbi:hypothetical protein X946_2866 [Burkholderia sp. ABCPW 111]|nr:hypothetical protein X946_2866 [Burkholderia sp. ABCPW 111]
MKKSRIKLPFVLFSKRQIKRNRKTNRSTIRIIKKLSPGLLRISYGPLQRIPRRLTIARHRQSPEPSDRFEKNNDPHPLNIEMGSGNSLNSLIPIQKKSSAP